MARLFLGAALALVLVAPAGAQGRPPAFESPEVQDDETVVFRYFAPSASAVQLSGQFLDGNVEMTKGDDGVWSYTTAPIEPDMYPYNFVVDGVSVSDPRNGDLFPNEGFQASIVEITGDEPLVHTVQDVPHGTVSYHYYTSPELGERPVVVYTPPGYEDDPDREYPILYLLHGTTDTEETWTKVGRANIILDNLIAAGDAEPMIVAMPYGRAYPTISTQSGSLREWENLQAFKPDFMEHLMPFVESTYRVRQDPESRAIAGFSGGGGTSLYFGLNNTDLFSYVVGFAPGMRVEEIERNNAVAFEDPDLTNERLNLFWMAVGEDDFTIRAIREYVEVLDDRGIEHEMFVSGGGHTWMNCKLYLSMLAPRLFQE